MSRGYSRSRLPQRHHQILLPDPPPTPTHPPAHSPKTQTETAPSPVQDLQTCTSLPTGCVLHTQTHSPASSRPATDQQPSPDHYSPHPPPPSHKNEQMENHRNPRRPIRRPKKPNRLPTRPRPSRHSKRRRNIHTQ